MNLLDIQSQIITLLAQFYAQVRGATYIGRTDFNKVAETVLIPLLSEIYGYSHLRNLNAGKANFPGIDLADDYARTSFQVTATSDSEKIKETLRKYRDYELYRKYDRLIIYILTQK
ncbi:MAG: SMEK domain-containing protein, partial [Bacillota bacterium]